MFAWHHLFPQMHPLWGFINEYTGKEIQEPNKKEKKVKILSAEVREINAWVLFLQQGIINLRESH